MHLIDADQVLAEGAPVGSAGAAPWSSEESRG
jgi:hypothetical protein